MNYKFTFIPFLILNLSASTIFATNVGGIIGGFLGDINQPDQAQPYVALVGLEGEVTPLSPLLSNGAIRGVALNNAGLGLIGGGDTNNSPYAALVQGGGVLTPVSSLPTSGFISSVALNNAGLGLCGGVKDSLTPYAALVKGGVASPLSPLPSNGEIFWVAINDSGLGLIGGRTGSNPIFGAYAALIEGESVVSLGGTLPSNGIIQSVALNDAGLGLIGGKDLNAAYAALIEGKSVVSLTGTPLPSSGNITSVALNDAGLGLIGGRSGTAPYAALIEGGSIVPLTDTPLPSNGTISSVALNNAGLGLIGGVDSSFPRAYAALIKGQTVTPLDLPFFPGLDGFPAALYSVALNDAGVGIIGGVAAKTGGFLVPFAALVSPTGQVTHLNLNTPKGAIASVGMGVLEAATPTSVGSSWGTFNSQFAASYALNSHLSRRSYQKGENEQQISLLVSAEDNIPLNQESVSESLGERSLIWVSPFGNYVHQKAHEGNPSSSNSIGGFLLGYDYSYSDLMFGGGVGYAYNYIGLGSGIGHGSVQEELATFYGSYEQECLLLNFALWGGFYQLYNKRNTLPSISSITSKSHTQGWTFTPHIEIATPFQRGIFFEPFAMVDYVSNWQGGYTEQGSSGLNLIMSKHYSSILRSEGGLRLFEEWTVGLGKFVFMQKLSYVNQLPFYFNGVSTSFVGSGSSFLVTTGNSQMQNLGGVELQGTFQPENNKYPYITFGFQGEFGSSYQSYFGNIEIGKAF